MSKTIIPNSKPKLSRAEVQKILDAQNVESAVALVGIRGYYAKSMGNTPFNERNIYDDAMFVVSPDAFVSFNANCDPSIFRMGIATLKQGVYRCVKWRHKGRYNALQIVRDVLTRDGQAGETAGRRGINIHYGSENDTWSEGCQTLPKSQWRAFVNLVYSEMDRHGQSTIPYILVEN